MPLYSIKLPQSKLMHITAKFTAYGAGIFELRFRPNIPIGEQNRFFMQLRHVFAPNFRWVADSFIVEDVAKLRPAIEFLVQNNYLHDNDRPNVSALLKEIDTTLEQRKNLSFSNTSAQKDLLIATAEIYIDDIIEQSASYDVAIVLLRLGFWHRTFTLTQGVLELINKHKINREILDSIHALWKFCQGEANLESTHARHSENKIPHIQAQRITLFDTCIAKLKAKFSNLDDENNLYMIIGMVLFLHPDQLLSPLEDTQKVIALALSQPNLPPTYQIVFQPNITALICGQGFRHMGLLPPEGENKKRIEALQRKFNSLLLKTFLETFERTIRFQEENLLWKGLKANSVDQVRLALSNGGDVNQYFPNGTTPLIMAAQQCDNEMLRTILFFKPEVNKLNQLGYFSALNPTMQRQNYEGTQILLDAGATLFQHCGIREAKQAVFSALPQFERALPFFVAWEYYVRNKNPVSLSIVKLILERGGAICLHLLGSEYEEVLNDSVVMLGGKLPPNSKANPICTAEQFLQRVNPSEYPRWLAIFDDFLRSPLPPLNLQATAEISRIKAHLHLKELKQSEPSASVPPSISITNQLSKDSPIALTGNAHEDLLRRIKPVVDSKPDVLGSFLKAVQECDYVKALRCACTCLHPQALVVLKTLLEYKDKLNIKIDEKTGPNEQAAIHYAALKGNTAAFDALVAAGADPELEDKKEISASSYRMVHEKPNSTPQINAPQP